MLSDVVESAGRLSSLEGRRGDVATVRNVGRRTKGGKVETCSSSASELRAAERSNIGMAEHARSNHLPVQ